MKKILSIFILLGIVIFSSCDPMEDIYDEIDAQGDPIVSAIEYLLTSDDYATIADLAVALDPGDTTNAYFLDDYDYFTSEISFQDYIAMFLNDRYPVQGPGSTAKITYNYNDSISEDLASYVDLDGYELVAANYDGVDSLVKIAQYLYPDFNPDLYLPGIISSSITGAEEGDMYLISYEYSDVNPAIDIVNNTKVFEEDFGAVTDDETIDIDGWSQYQEAGTAAWEGREYGGNLYGQFSAYSSGEASNIAWLITDAIDLTEYSEVILNLKSKDGYNNGDALTVLISEDYSGTGNPTAANWVALNPTLSTGNSGGFASDWVESGDISLNEYVGGEVYIAFKYVGGDGTITTTMQIDDVEVIALTAGFEVIGPDEYTAKDYYEYNGAEWEKMSNIHYLSSKDYDAMGDPGSHDNFSSSILAQDYLPKYLDNLYPTAGEGISVIVVYDYYTGINYETVTIADEYTYTSGEWVSSYSYVQEMTAQWAVSSATNKWVFDPTETITLTNDEYKYIVDYVIDNFDAEFIGYDSRREYYYGVSEKYNNFDITSGKYNEDVFDSWEEATATALSDVLLPHLYPNATLQVNGVDMFYRIIFNTYSGSNALYVIKFQVTKAGPDPEFTLVEGPELL